MQTKIEEGNKFVSILLNFFKIVFIIGIIFYICFSLNAAISYNFIINNYRTAYEHGYNYIEKVVMHSDMTGCYSFVFSLLYIIGIIHFSILFKNKKTFSGLVLFLTFPLFFIIYNYQNVDTFMYGRINELYDKASQLDSKFAISPIGLRFSKALEDKNYDELKLISNNLESLITMPSKDEKILDIIKVIPVPKIQVLFNDMNKGFFSITDYRKFYTQAEQYFQESNIAHQPEYILLFSMLKPFDKYDTNMFIQHYRLIAD